MNTPVNKIRSVRFTPYRKGYGPTFTLTLFDTGRSDAMGKHILGYRLTQTEKGKRTTLFDGADFACSPLHCIDSDETIASLMCFLTLRERDTDAEYFADYTPEQLAYSENHAESLGCEVSNRFGEF